MKNILTQVAEVKDELKLNMVRLSEREGKLEDLEDKVETFNFIKENYIWFKMYNQKEEKKSEITHWWIRDMICVSVGRRWIRICDIFWLFGQGVG